MALSDSIGDMLTCIRNASSARKEVVEVKGSKFSEEILKILKSEGFIKNYKFMKDDRQGVLRVYLRYGPDGSAAITGLRRISKPGLRVYKRKSGLPRVYGGIGVAVVSTPKGLMTDTEARKNNLGGEVVCYAW
jgi:small subunit ribosomal protein S8